MRAFSLMIVAAATSACLGAYSATPEELARYEFVAAVRVNPTAPQPGRNVSLSVELVSRSNALVTVDVVLKAVRPDGSIMHTQVWREVKFHPEEVWNLTQGFVPRNDEKGTFAIELETLESGTDKLLWQGDGPSLTFRPL